MFKWVDAPMRDLADVLDWHSHQLELAQSRLASRDQFPRLGSSAIALAHKKKLDQKKIDFHQGVVTILQSVLDAPVASTGQAQAPK